jgi:hypothetical protein
MQARICYHAKVGKHYADLIKNVFGPENRSRLKFVLGTQAAWFGPIEVFYFIIKIYFFFNKSFFKILIKKIFFLCPDNVSLAYDVISIAPYLSNNSIFFFKYTE